MVVVDVRVVEGWKRGWRRGGCEGGGGVDKMVVREKSSERAKIKSTDNYSGLMNQTYCERLQVERRPNSD